MKQVLENLKGERVVIDTCSSFIYIGTLLKVTGGCAVLSDVDVHDCTDSSTSKELYIFESRTTGIRSNRENVFISLDYIISFSPLEDVKQF